MCARIDPLNLAQGLRLGQSGEYVLIKPIGRGWEGEVYLAIRTHSGNKFNAVPGVLKAIKFIPVKGLNDIVAPTWNNRNIRFGRKTPFSNHIVNGAEWFEDFECRKGWIEALNHVKEQARLHKILSKKHSMLVPPVNDFGVTVLPANGCLQLFMYFTMPYIHGIPFEVVLENKHADSSIYQTLAEKLLLQLVTDCCSMYARGFLIEGDIQISNLILSPERFYLVDVDIVKHNEEIMLLVEVLEIIFSVAYQVLNWDILGKMVESYHQGIATADWLEDWTLLKKLPGSFPENVEKQVKEMIKSVGIVDSQLLV